METYFCLYKNNNDFRKPLLFGEIGIKTTEMGKREGRENRGVKLEVRCK